MKRKHGDVFGMSGDDGKGVVRSNKIRNTSCDRARDSPRNSRTAALDDDPSFATNNSRVDSRYDYASGPARMVHVHEDGKDVPALILSWELAQQLQVSVQAMRLVCQSSNFADSQLAQLKAFEQRIHERQDHIRTLRDGYPSAFEGNSLRIEDLDHEHSFLDDADRQVRRDRRFIERRHHEMSDRVFITYGRIAEAIEELLEDSGLLQPGTDFPQATHWDRAFARRLTALDALPDLSAAVEETRRYNEYARLQPSPPEYASSDGQPVESYNYYRTTRALQEAEHNFRMHCGRDEEVVAWRSRQPVVPAGQTASERDRGHLITSMALTRLLIEAEEAVRNAKRKAAAAGYEYLDENQTSMFGDRPGAKDGVEQPAPIVVPMDRERIERWRQGVTIGDTLSGFKQDDTQSAEVEIDVWEARGVAVGEGGSVIAIGRDRARIDQWRAQCEDLVKNQHEEDERSVCT